MPIPCVNSNTSSLNKELKSPLKVKTRVVAIAIGALCIVAGLFMLLASAQVFPQGVNAISSLKGAGYFLGILPIVTGLFSIVKGSQNSQAQKRIQTEVSVNLSTPSILAKKTPLGPFCSKPFKFSFFHYDCDEIKDYGWGCAWRCMQMIASSLGLSPSFNELYNTYRLDPNSVDEWAEPGYCKRYLDDLGVPSQLALFNRETGTSKTPTNLCEKINGFSNLRSVLKSHFSNYSTPVMADDESYAFAIVGIRITENNETILSIADPHKTSAESGRYEVTLNEEGTQIATTGIDDSKNGLESVKRVFFTKGWLLLFPRPTASAAASHNNPK